MLRLLNDLRHTFLKDNDKGLPNTQLAQGTLDPMPAQNPSAASILHKSSSVSPGNTVSQSNDIPKNILAFRLITKTLARIPQTQPFPSIDNLRDCNKQWTDDDRREVKISDAFAHLAVAEHDVVAIATNRSSPHHSLQEDPTLGIIACTNLSSYSEGPMKSPNTPLKFFYKVWNIIFAKNAQRSDPPRSYPTITLPDEPIDFKNFESLNAYMNNLEANW